MLRGGICPKGGRPVRESNYHDQPNNDNHQIVNMVMIWWGVLLRTSVRRHCPLWASHILIVLSLDPVAAYNPPVFFWSAGTAWTRC